MAAIEMTCLLPNVLPWSFSILILNGVTYGTNHLIVHIKKRKTVSNKEVAYVKTIPRSLLLKCLIHFKTFYHDPLQL